MSSTTEVSSEPKTYYRSASFAGYHASGSGSDIAQAEFNAKDALLSYLYSLEVQGDEMAGIYLEYLDNETYSPEYGEEIRLFVPYKDE
jgi:hypothetical protein